MMLCTVIGPRGVAMKSSVSICARPFAELVDKVFVFLWPAIRAAFPSPQLQRYTRRPARVECVVQGDRCCGETDATLSSNHTELNEHTNIVRPIPDPRKVADYGGTATAEGLVNRLNKK